MRGKKHILPGTGRGTLRSRVEGSRRWHPSTACGGPLPLAGEDGCVPRDGAL
jgi:hypothetical protein